MEGELEEAVRAIRPCCRTDACEGDREGKQGRKTFRFQFKKVLARLPGSPEANSAHQRNPASSGMDLP